jgi:hypothetical protein
MSDIPYGYEYDDARKLWSIVRYGQGGSDATYPRGTANYEHDAMLFAAAPVLFEACRLLVLLEDEDVHEFDTRWKQARKTMRDAIAMAEGRSE